MSLENEELEPLEGTALDTLGEGGAVEDDDSDMMAGYTQAGGGDGVDTVAKGPMKDGETDLNGDPAPGADAGAASTPAKAAAAPGQAAATPAATPAPPRIGRWTEDEIAQRFADLDGLKKGQSTVAGAVGELRQRLDKSGQPKTLTAADLPGVVEEFGETYATALANDLNKLSLGGPSGPSQSEIDTLVNARAEQHVQELERKLEKKAVMRAHKDADDHFSTLNADGQTWTHGAKAVAFKGWVGSLPQDRQTLIANSWDSDVMIQALADFKEFEKKATAAAPGATPVAPARQSRVDRAATPRGSGAAAPIVEDDLAAGYNAARGKK